MRERERIWDGNNWKWKATFCAIFFRRKVHINVDQTSQFFGVISWYFIKRLSHWFSVRMWFFSRFIVFLSVFFALIHATEFVKGNWPNRIIRLKSWWIWATKKSANILFHLNCRWFLIAVLEIDVKEFNVATLFSKFEQRFHKFTDKTRNIVNHKNQSRVVFDSILFTLSHLLFLLVVVYFLHVDSIY